MYDVAFQFAIKDWAMDIDDEDYPFGKWKSVDFSLKSSYINYTLTDDELFNTVEILHLKERLEELLAGEIKDDCKVSFAEPDFTFLLYPARRLYSIPGKISYRNGYMDRPLFMEMKVQFWCKEGGLGQNIFQMSFCEDEVRAFLTYLKFITGEITEKDKQYIRFIRAGVLVPD